MGTRTDPIRTAFKNMTITVPTTTQIAASLEGSARAIAAILVAVYVAGATLREWVAGVADFAQRLTSRPLDTLIELVPTVEPEPSVLAVLGATLLDPETLDLEIAAYDAAAKPAKRPAARRKPATAPKAAVAA